MGMRYSILLLSIFLAACSHTSARTSTERSSENVVAVMPATYAMMSTPQTAGNLPVSGGHVSRYQRQIIIPGGTDGAMTPCAQNFDAVMDHLESLMEKQINENNEIARQQAAIPGYSF